MVRTALVLAGHGSHISPHTAGIIWRHVDSLRALGMADEITAAFWKETPSFATVLQTLTADDITIVPLFTAQGFFTRRVIPAEMGLRGAITEREGRTLRYARTVGEHPYLREMVERRIDDTLRGYGLNPAQTAAVIIGHGTRRNPDSRAAAENQAQALREMQLVAEVAAVYLDDTPGISDAYALTRAPTLIAVPYFLAAGSHATLDVPRALGLSEGQMTGQINGRTVLYTAPVGTEDALLEVIVQLAHEAGMPPLYRSGGSGWDSVPAAGREELIEAVLQSDVLRFGQLKLTPNEVSVWGDESIRQTFTTPAELRACVRENPFRPLATSDDLPGGWRVEVESNATLHAVVETVYPGAVADWAAHRHREFRWTAFESFTARQVGMFRELACSDEIVRRVCVGGGCVRHPTWFYGGSPHDAIPCSEPCNVWASAAKEAQT